MSGPQQTEILQIWQKKETEKKIDIYAVSVHDCTQEQNGSPYFAFPSFDNANGRLYQDPEILLPR